MHAHSPLVCADELVATATMPLIRIIEDLVAKPRETVLASAATRTGRATNLMFIQIKNLPCELKTLQLNRVAYVSSAIYDSIKARNLYTKEAAIEPFIGHD